MIYRILLAGGLAGLMSGACEAADLKVSVEGLRSNSGQVLICVFSAESSDPSLFPDCAKGRPVKSAKAPIAGGKVIMTFNGLKDGVYAVAIIHDENGNGELDTNLLGIPTEGVGVSTNPRLFGKPKFADGKFNISGNTAISIETKYIL
jgi:uncharacterized protein (DUF2141 family)